MSSTSCAALSSCCEHATSAALTDVSAADALPMLCEYSMAPPWLRLSFAEARRVRHSQLQAISAATTATAPAMSATSVSVGMPLSLEPSVRSFLLAAVESPVGSSLPPEERRGGLGGDSGLGGAAGGVAGGSCGGGGGEAWADVTPLLVTGSPVAIVTEAVSDSPFESALVFAKEPGGVVTVVVEVMPVTLELVIDRPSTAAAEIGTVSPAP